LHKCAPPAAGFFAFRWWRKYQADKKQAEYLTKVPKWTSTLKLPHEWSQIGPPGRNFEQSSIWSMAELDERLP
jgi:hypothetical protein